MCFGGRGGGGDYKCAFVIHCFTFQCHFVLTMSCDLQLVSQHGAEADRHLFRCLLSYIDFSGDGKSSGKDLYQVCLYILYMLLTCLKKQTKSM